MAKVFDPLEDRKFGFCREMAKILGIDVKPVETAETAVHESDIVVCASTPKIPLFSAMCLSLGTHINAIGAFTPTTRELGTDTVSASKVVVDSREAALREAGDIIIPIREGAITAAHIWAELGEVIVGRKAGRTNDKETTLFKSVGLALQDTSTAKVAYKKALKIGIGTEVKI